MPGVRMASGSKLLSTSAESLLLRPAIARPSVEMPAAAAPLAARDAEGIASGKSGVESATATSLSVLPPPLPPMLTPPVSPVRSVNCL